MKVHHLNCGILHVPPGPQAACHALLLELPQGLVLVDPGIGLQDIARPRERIGQAVIDAAGFQFHESLTAVRQIERLGFRGQDVQDVVLTHGDPDHAGGLADFPTAQVHLSAEEYAELTSGRDRYSRAQFAHAPHWVLHQSSSERWFGLEARPLLPSKEIEAFVIPLFGHTRGHCGVAVRHQNRWLLHVGDAYYLRDELTRDDHPVSALATLRAENDPLRRASLEQLRRLARDHSAEIDMFGYHDFTEFPAETGLRNGAFS